MPAKNFSRGRGIAHSLLIVLLSSGLSHSEAEAQETSGSPQELAKRVLRIYRTKDIGKLLAFSPGGAPPSQVLEAFAPGTRRYNSLFGDSSWRWQAVSNWSGKIDSVRFDRSALVPFASAKKSKQANAVWLKLQGGKWKFDSMGSVGSDGPARRDLNKVIADDVAIPTVGDLKSAAVRILKAFQAKDVDAVLKLSVKEGPAELMYLSDEEKLQPKADFLFSEEQTGLLEAWDGEIETVYIRESAQAEFGRSGSEVFVVTMQRFGDEWKFDDIHSPDIESFDAMEPAQPVGGEKEATEPGLQLYSNAQGRFQVKMPGKPKHDVEKIGEGPDAVQHQYLVGAPNGVYMISYQDHPDFDVSASAAEVEELLIVARDGFQKAIKGEQIEYRSITQGEIEGRETVTRIKSMSGVAKTRMFFVKQRWYQVLVMGVPEFVNSATAQQFLDSFRVIGDVAKPDVMNRKNAIQKLKDF